MTLKSSYMNNSNALKPGGCFFGKTPNRNHYMPLAARLTPLSFHKWFNKKRGRPEITYVSYLLSTEYSRADQENIFEKRI